MNVMIFGDKLFSLDMAWGFEDLGHTIQLVFPRNIIELRNQITAMEPDLFLTLGSPAFYEPAQLSLLKSRPAAKTKYVHWDTDGITWKDIEMNHIRLMQPDIVFTVCPEMLVLLKSLEIPCDMLPYAYCPKYHHPSTENKDFTHDIAFVGSAYPNVLSAHPDHYRRISLDVLFKPLLENGYRIDLYGDNQHQQVLQSLYGTTIPDTGCTADARTKKHGRSIARALSTWLPKTMSTPLLSERLKSWAPEDWQSVFLTPPSAIRLHQAKTWLHPPTLKKRWI